MEGKFAIFILNKYENRVETLYNFGGVVSYIPHNYGWSYLTVFLK